MPPTTTRHQQSAHRVATSIINRLPNPIRKPHDSAIAGLESFFHNSFCEVKHVLLKTEGGVRVEVWDDDDGWTRDDHDDDGWTKMHDGKEPGEKWG